MASVQFARMHRRGHYLGLVPVATKFVPVYRHGVLLGTTPAKVPQAFHPVFRREQYLGLRRPASFVVEATLHDDEGKLLAALNLPQVGDIKLVSEPDEEDKEWADVLFSIHLNDRDYLLRAPDATTAARWVEVLNQLKTNATNVVPPEKQAGAAEDNKWSKKSRGGLPRACCPCLAR